MRAIARFTLTSRKTRTPAMTDDEFRALLAAGPCVPMVPREVMLALLDERDALRAEVAALRADMEIAQANVLAENEARVAAEAEVAALRQAVERARREALEEAARAIETHRFEREQMMLVGPGRHGLYAIRPGDAKDYLAAAIRARAGGAGDE
jgi:hypothetical protein